MRRLLQYCTNDAIGGEVLALAHSASAECRFYESFDAETPSFSRTVGAQHEAHEARTSPDAVTIERDADLRPVLNERVAALAPTYLRSSIVSLRMRAELLKILGKEDDATPISRNASRRSSRRSSSRILSRHSEQEDEEEDDTELAEPDPGPTSDQDLEMVVEPEPVENDEDGYEQQSLSSALKILHQLDKEADVQQDTLDRVLDKLRSGNAPLPTLATSQESCWATRIRTQCLNRDATSDQTLAFCVSGGYVFVHCSEGFFKLGSGLCNTVAGHVYAYRDSFEGDSEINLCVCGDFVYVTRSSLPKSFVLRLLTENLEDRGFAIFSSRRSPGEEDEEDSVLSALYSDGSSLWRLKTSYYDCTNTSRRQTFLLQFRADDASRCQTVQSSVSEIDRERNLLATELWGGIGFSGSQEACTEAILAFNDDPNTALQFLTDNANQLVSTAFFVRTRTFNITPSPEERNLDFKLDHIFFGQRELVVLQLQSQTVRSFPNIERESREYAVCIFSTEDGKVIGSGNNGLRPHIQLKGSKCVFDVSTNILYDFDFDGTLTARMLLCPEPYGPAKVAASNPLDVAELFISYAGQRARNQKGERESLEIWFEIAAAVCHRVQPVNDEENQRVETMLLNFLRAFYYRLATIRDGDLPKSHLNLMQSLRSHIVSLPLESQKSPIEFELGRCWCVALQKHSTEALIRELAKPSCENTPVAMFQSMLEELLRKRELLQILYAPGNYRFAKRQEPQLLLHSIECVLKMDSSNSQHRPTQLFHSLSVRFIAAVLQTILTSLENADSTFLDWLCSLVELMCKNFSSYCLLLANEQRQLGGAARQNSTFIDIRVRSSLLSVLPTLLSCINEHCSVFQSHHLCLLLRSFTPLLSALDKLCQALPESHQEDNRSAAVKPSLVYELQERSFETSHPYSNGRTSLASTIRFEGVKLIAVSFDSRCSTLQNRHTLKIFLGEESKNFVGPFYGCGNRSSWPTNTLLLPGPTLRFVFEAPPIGRDAPRKVGATDNGFGVRCKVRTLQLDDNVFCLDLLSLLGSVVSTFSSELFSSGKKGSRARDARLSRLLFDAGASQGTETSAIEEQDREFIGENAVVSPDILAIRELQNDFLQLGPRTSALRNHMLASKHRFLGSSIIEKQGIAVQQRWREAVRSIMLAMLKFSGLLHGWLNAMSKSSIEQTKWIRLRSKQLQTISVRAQQVQEWMMRLSQAYRRWNLLVEDASELSKNELMLEFGHSDDRDLLHNICNAAGIVVNPRADTQDLISELYTCCMASSNNRGGRKGGNEQENPFGAIANRVCDTANDLLAFRASLCSLDDPFDSLTSAADNAVDMPDVTIRSHSVFATPRHLEFRAEKGASSSGANKPRDLLSMTRTQSVPNKEAEGKQRRGIQNYHSWKVWQKSREAPSSGTSFRHRLGHVAQLLQEFVQHNELQKISTQQFVKARYRSEALELFGNAVESLSLNRARFALLGAVFDALRQRLVLFSDSDYRVAGVEARVRNRLVRLQRALLTISESSSSWPQCRRLAVCDFAVLACGDPVLNHDATRSVLCSVVSTFLALSRSTTTFDTELSTLRHSLLEALALLVVRILGVGFDDVLIGRELLESGSIDDWKSLQKMTLRLLDSVIKSSVCIATASGLDGATRSQSNDDLTRILSLLCQCAELPGFASFSRAGIMFAFSSVLQRLNCFPPRILHLVLKLSRRVLPFESVQRVTRLFSADLPSFILDLIAQHMTFSCFDNELPEPICSVALHWSSQLAVDSLMQLLSGPYQELTTSNGSSLQGIAFSAAVSGDIAGPPVPEQSEAVRAYEERCKHRHGNERVSFLEIGGADAEVESESGKVISRNGFASVVSDVSVSGGCWYYELHLQTGGLMQVGYSASDFTPNSDAGCGVGDDQHSWAYDGHRRFKWHLSQDRYGALNWESGDVVGVALDLEHGGQLRFFLNGNDLGVAFDGLKGPLHVACSFASNEGGVLVLEPGRFRYNAPNHHFPLQGDMPQTTASPWVRARALHQSLCTHGRHLLLQGALHHCTHAVEMLSAQGFTATIVGADELKQKHAHAVVIDGFAARCIASELVAFSRFLFRASGKWRASMAYALQHVLSHGSCAFLHHHSNPTPNNSTTEMEGETNDDPMHLRIAARVVGALCVIGGFSETLREGGTVLLDAASGSNSMGTVVRFKTDDEYADVVILDDSASSRSGGNGSRLPLMSPAPCVSNVARRHHVLVSELRVVPEMLPDFMSDFKLTQEMANALTELQSQCAEINHSNMKSTGAAGEAKQSGSARWRWLSLEVEWRASFILEIVALSTRVDDGAKRTASEALQRVARRGLRQWMNRDVAEQVAVANALRERLWTMFSGQIALFAPRGIEAIRCGNLSAVDSDDSAEGCRIISVARDKCDTTLTTENNAGTRMLAHWERMIIPRLKTYVRSSFRDYEMVYFFEQLRQPLRVANAEGAIHIAHTLVNNRLPEGIVFPPLDYDWSALTIADMQVGQRIAVVPAMCIGSVVARHGDLTTSNDVIGAGSGCVLVQTYSAADALLEEKWYDVEALRESQQVLTSHSRAHRRLWSNYDDAVDFLSRTQLCLSTLIARRELRSQVSQSADFANTLLDVDVNTEDVGDSLALLFSSLCGTLQHSLDSIGIVHPAHEKAVHAFATNVRDVIASRRLGSALLAYFEQLLNDAWQFLEGHSCDLALQLDGDIKCISCPGASQILLIFDSELEAGRSFAVFTDAECTQLVQSFGSSDIMSASVRLGVCTVPADQCWIRPSTNQCSGPVPTLAAKVMGVSPTLTLLFWVAHFVLQNCGVLFDVNKTSDVGFRLVDGLCARLHVDSLAGSPIQEAVLGLISDVLSKVAEVGPAHPSSDVAKQCLDSLRGFLYEEAMETMMLEGESYVHSGLLQQLLRVQFSADYLRPPDQRLFQFRQGQDDDQQEEAVDIVEEPIEEQPEEPEEVPAANWQCSVCTLLNELDATVCSVCESARPAVVQEVEPAAAAADATTTTKTATTEPLTREQANATCVEIFSLLESMLWLLGKHEEPNYLSTGVRHLVQGAWRESLGARVESNMLLVQSVPLSTKEVDARLLLAQALNAVAQNGGSKCTEPSEIWFGSASNDALAGPVPSIAEARALRHSLPRKKTFIYESDFDENGLIYYLGTRACTTDFCNPVELGSMTVTASSLQNDSVAAQHAIGREATRCVTQAIKSQSFEIVFKQCAIVPSHYTLRHYSSWHSEALRNWNLEAFCESTSSWVCLRKHVNDMALSRKGASHTWSIDVDDNTTTFSRFRILMTGPNSNHHYYLALSGFEIYGEAEGDQIAVNMPFSASPIFAVVPVSGSAATCEELAHAADGTVLEWPDWFRTRISVVSCSTLWEKDDVRLEQFLVHKLLDDDDDVTKSRLRPRVERVLYRALANAGLVQSCTCEHCEPSSLHAHLDALGDDDTNVSISVTHASFNAVHLQMLADSEFCSIFMRAWARSMINVDGDVAFVQLCNALAVALSDGDENAKSVFDTFAHLGFDMNLCEAYITSESAALDSLASWTKRPARTHEALLRIIENAAESQNAAEPSLLSPSKLWVSASDRMQLRHDSMSSPLDSLAAIRLRFCLLKQFNHSLEALLPYFNLQAQKAHSALNQGLLLRGCRCFIFRHVKNSFVLRMLDVLSLQRESPPRVEIDRMEVAQAREQGSRDFLLDTCFGRAFTQLKDVPGTLLRPVRPNGADPFVAFDVVFSGEQVVGTGGPYRQFFSDIAVELVAEDSPLFIACPNNQGSVGNNQDRFVIRPSATSALDLAMFEFLGVLFGCCLRTGVRIAVDLACFSWAPIVGDQLTPADLCSIDLRTMQVLDLLSSIESETFDETVSETYETPLSDRTIVPLSEHKANTDIVLFEDRHEYVKMVLDVRLHEASLQTEAIVRGMTKILPPYLFGLFLPDELSVLISGRADVDVALLQRHTIYGDSNPEAPHILYFWQVLTEFSQDQRRSFIRFAWAQERLPADDVEFERAHIRLLLKTDSRPNPDSRFPKADTCFFNLALPRYSSKAVLRDRLLFAINNTNSMNADEEAQT